MSVTVDPPCTFTWTAPGKGHDNTDSHACRFKFGAHGYHECVCGAGGGEQALREVPADEVDRMLAKLAEGGTEAKAPVQTGAVVHTELDDLINARLRDSIARDLITSMFEGPRTPQASFLGPTVSGEPSVPGQSQHSHGNAHDFSVAGSWSPAQRGFLDVAGTPLWAPATPQADTPDTPSAKAGWRARLRSSASRLLGRCADRLDSERG